MIEAEAQRFRLAQAFTISRGTRTHAEVVRATVTRAGVTGQGECVPYPRYGETADGVIAAIKEVDPAIDRAGLHSALPPGAARNALDCALWDLEAKTRGQPAHALAGLDAPGPVSTAYTLSLDTPAAMREAAAKEAHRPLLKIKLGGGHEDQARIEAVRAGAPDAKLIVDANEGWDAEAYRRLAPRFVDLGVAMVEQPLPAADDAALAELDRPLPVCADESCHDRGSLAALKGRYDMVNIKLDKTGGLTEALALKAEAEAAGFAIMVGCMVGTSLAMAPAILVAQGAEIVDLDGALLLAEDRAPPLAFDSAGLHPAPPALWG
ncbi:MAG: N-acetyl-D-Glu racemase DgcA [Pseudomonadota bacterium]